MTFNLKCPVCNNKGDLFIKKIALSVFEKMGDGEMK